MRIPLGSASSSCRDIHPPPFHTPPPTTVFERNCNDFADAAVRFLTGGEVEMPGYILDNSQNALSELPKSQAALTRSIANQVARVVMLAWGTANRSKEEVARREARRAAGGGGGGTTAGEAG